MSQLSQTPEDAKLDEAIKLVAPRLSASLQKEHRRRRFNYSIAGVVLMSTVLTLALVFVFGFFDDKEESKGLTSMGWQQIQSGQQAFAEKSFQAATKADPKSADAWNGLGWARMHLGKLEDSTTAFEKCLEISPKHTAALNGLGQLYLRQRKYDKAEEYLLKAEGASAAWYGLVRVYILTEKFDKAKTFLDKIHNDDSVPRLDVEAFDKAIKDRKLTDELRQKIEPPLSSTTDRLSQQGWRSLNSGLVDDAIKLFRQALEQKPDDESAQNGLGFALLNSGKVDEAIPLFERLIQKSPQALGAKNGLARCYLAKGKSEDAVKIWKEVESAVPEVNAATVGLATYYMDKQLYSEAIPFLERIVADKSADPQQKEHYQKLLEKAKQQTKK